LYFCSYKNNLVQVSSVNCHADPLVCRQLQPQSAILFYQAEHFPSNDSYSIMSLNPKEIVGQILALLPDLNLITEDHLNVRELK
jgi:hypothetical protein